MKMFSTICLSVFVAVKLKQIGKVYDRRRSRIEKSCANLLQNGVERRKVSYHKRKPRRMGK